MDTGIFSIILHLLPYHFTAQGILSTILFVLNLLLFTLFSLLSIIRLIRYRTHVRSQTLSSLDSLSYLGAPATAYLTLVAQVSLTCSSAWGHPWTLVAYALWWLGLIWTISLTSFTLIILLKRAIIPYTRDISPVIFLPLISVMTLGTTGGIVTNYSIDMTTRLAVPVIVTGYMAIGYAFFLALMYYVLMTHRLIVHGLPEPAKIPALMILVGPLGQFATAIQVLSTAASSKGMIRERGCKRMQRQV